MGFFRAASTKDLSDILLDGKQRGKLSAVPVAEVTGSGSIIQPGNAQGLSKHFRRVSNTSRDLNFNADASPDIAVLEPPTGELWYVNIITVIVESTLAVFSTYGSLTLTTGITIQQHGKPTADDPDQLLFDLTEEGPVISFSDFSGIGAEGLQEDTGGVNPDTQIAQFPFRKTNGRSVELDGDLLQRIEVTLDDNFSTLSKHRFSANGLRIIKAIV